MGRRAITTAVLAAVIGLSGSGCAGESNPENTITAEGPGTDVPTTLAPTTTRASTTTAAPSTPAPTTAAAGSTPTATPREPLFDFPTADDVRGWRVVNDTVMGGVSTGRLAWERNALVFTGTLSLDNNGGFASVRSPLVDPAAAARWAGRTGLGVEVRGGGRAWTLEVRMDGEDGGWISAITTPAGTITAVEVPWATFVPVTRFLGPRTPAAPLDPSRIVSVAFYLVDKIEAPFRLELRSID
jgi:hypothetical protein